MLCRPIDYKDFILKCHIIYLFNIIIETMEILNFILSLYSSKLAHLCYPVFEVWVYFTSRIVQIFCNFVESFATKNIRLLSVQQTVNKILHKALMSRHVFRHCSLYCVYAYWHEALKLFWATLLAYRPITYHVAPHIQPVCWHVRLINSHIIIAG